MDNTIRLIQQRVLSQVLHLVLKHPLPYFGEFESTNGRQPQVYIYDFDKEQPLYLVASFSDTLAFYRYDDDLSPNGRLIIVDCEIISSIVLKSTKIKSDHPLPFRVQVSEFDSPISTTGDSKWNLNDLMKDVSPEHLAEGYSDEGLMTREEFDLALKSYETAHGMSSAEFYKKWMHDEIPDEIEFNMWAGLYEFSLEDGLVFKESSSPQLEKTSFTLESTRKLENIIERVGA